MQKNNPWLFLIPSLIWGSTWFVIKFQLGEVDPLISVVYRYLLAGLIMIGYCFVVGKSMSFSKKDHLYIALQGFLLFGINYWLVYEAEVYLTSGLVAVAFSLIVFLNALFGRLLMSRPINRQLMLAAVFGLSGTALIFYNELTQLDFTPQVLNGTWIVLVSVVLASLGNIASARNSANNIPVIQANAFGMLYGGLSMALLSLVLGRSFTFDMSVVYVGSLMYLTVFGSIIAFGTYLTLISKVGADKAAYALVTIPVISILISYVFEDYVVTLSAVSGVVLILIGNVLAIRK